jgi:membrane-bound serine protease (ClpP class)
VQPSAGPRARAKFSWLAAGIGLALAALNAAWSVSSAQDASGKRQAQVIAVEGAIGPVIADYIAEKLQQPDPAKTGLVILRIDTPGGLDTAMREIIRAQLASRVPVAVYVAPSGARAASAGTYILYAASVAAMAPGTNLGAATPITIGGAPGFPERAPERQEPDKPKQDESKMQARRRNQPTPTNRSTPPRRNGASWSMTRPPISAAWRRCTVATPSGRNPQCGAPPA